MRQISVRSVENIAAAEASVEESPNVSHVILSRWASLWRPYKIKLTQELRPLDHKKSRMLVNWAEQQLENDFDFYRKIIFSDEAHFWLNGFVIGRLGRAIWLRFLWDYVKSMIHVNKPATSDELRTNIERERTYWFK